MGNKHNNDIDEILQNHGITPTPVRHMVYRSLQDSLNPISLLELEMHLETVDRSSISRTLTTFRNNHLVHAFNDGSGSVKYEICDANSHSISDMHIHFHCTKCGVTKCLPSIKMPAVELPEGYLPENVNYVISGICPECNKTKTNQ